MNGTPEQARNIMLLDTATGRSFITCEMDGATGWCPLPSFGGKSAVAPKE